MNSTPNTQESLTAHFSRRSSAARVAWTRLLNRQKQTPLTDTPKTVVKVNPQFDELPHR
jgi:hypothetical protein